MKFLGNVIKLFISELDNAEKIEVQSINCNLDGIIGDKFYKRDKNRSILLSSLHSYNLAKQNGIDISYGTLGENILLDFDPHNLQIGTKIYIGDAILELSQECTLCKHLTTINNKLPKLLKKDRGIFAYALNEAKININDKVYMK